MEEVTKLEKEYSEFIGSKYAVAVNSGTSALHTALVALGIGKGDEVIMPDFTMAACGFAVLYTGATPVFVDCKDDLNIDEKYIEEKITKNTKAIMAVHIYGRLCNMKEINRIAKKHKLFVIEDACEAQGADIGHATITCHSFYNNKIVHGEEGGMVTTNLKRVADKIRDLKNMSFGKEHNYFHKSIGYNYRMPNSQAVIIRESLRNVERNLKKRRQVESWYREFLGDNLPKRDVVWVFDKLGKKPKVKESRHFFKPLSSMPMFPESDSIKAYHYASRGYYLQVYPDMTKSQVKEICQKVIVV